MTAASPEPRRLAGEGGERLELPACHAEQAMRKLSADMARLSENFTTLSGQLEESFLSQQIRAADFLLDPPGRLPDDLRTLLQAYRAEVIGEFLSMHPGWDE